MLRGRALAGAVLLALLALGVGSSRGAEGDDGSQLETIDLQPDDRASWSLRNVFAPVTGFFFGGPGYWYGERVVEIDTTPPGAVVDLFYVRSNFQKRYEQAETPVRVLLPRRIEAGPRDALTVRALLEGYRQQSTTIRVNSRQQSIHLDLAPLPNTLVAVSHRYLAGRAALVFMTKESLTFRVQEGGDAFSVILTETGRSPEAAATLDSLRSPVFEGAVSRQLGEDLVVQLELAEAFRDRGFDLTTRQRFDPARELHFFGFQIEPKGGAAAEIQRAREALGRIGTADVTGCALEFESALRERLDPAGLSRAFAPSGDFTDPYFRAAMRRLGELVPGGAVEFADGSKLHPATPIELEAAITQAAGARGYLALLRRFVAELEEARDRRLVYGGLVAPELGTADFGALMDAAETRESACRGVARRAAVPPMG